MESGRGRGGGGLTLSTMSIMDSSVDEASLRIARKAAMRTLSSALDHSSRHFYTFKVSECVCVAHTIYFVKEENKKQQK
jgi:hypothetical protein